MNKLNNHFTVVFQPKECKNGKRRFCIGVYRLSLYVGEKNAKKAIERAIRETAKGDKCRVKLRKHGIIDFYNR